MNREELRAVQAPIKERYRDNPDAAVITLHADGSLADGISCSVDTGRAVAAVAGLDPASGGGGSLLCSGDMLLQALAACAGVRMRAMGPSIGSQVRGGTVHGEGDL